MDLVQSAPLPIPPKKDYTLVVILSFTTLLATLIAFFFYFQNQELRKLIIVPSPTPLPSPTATPDPTTDWKTYINTKYTYEVKYPITLKLVENSIVPDPTSLYLQRVNFEFDSNSSISIAIQATAKFIPSYDSVEIKDYKPITINNIKGKQGQEFGNAYFLRTNLYGNKYSVSVEYTGEEKQSQIDIYNQILSTFKFTEALSTPSASPASTP